MASYNRVILVGNLTFDPELRHIPSGTAVTELRLAVNDRVKRDGQWVDEAHFFDVTVWGRTAEIANEYLSKGSSVLIEGRLRYSTWEKDGQKRSKVDVVADKMQMLGGRGGGGGGGGGGPHRQKSSDYGGGDEEYSSAPAPSMPPDDEIPF